MTQRLIHGARALVYLLLSVPLAVVGVPAAAVALLGAILTVVWVGAPLRNAGWDAARVVGRLDRWLANRVLAAGVPPVSARRMPRGRFDALSDPRLWRLIAIATLKPLVAAAALAVAGAAMAVTVRLAVLGAQGVAGGGPDAVGPWDLGLLTGLALLTLAVPFVILSVALLDGLFHASRALLRLLLVPRSAPEGPAREMLAESLGDRSLTVAYYLPDRGGYVDEAGLPVELPDGRGGRTWTAVERDGHRVAAIVHDAALDASPELVQAAADASVMALDNERLKADLRARVEELRLSRVRIVQAADEARRRLERDLHDGAQQQLVSLALDLRLLRGHLEDHDAAAEAEAAAAKLQTALSELRELARGIHPAILTDRGLGPAIEALATRCAVPVETRVAVDDRLAPAVEAAAYFVVAEALTNVAKYAQAETVEVGLAVVDDALVVEVSDDGVGGATMHAGSGLRGLEDRVAVLDGTLHVESPEGGGTRLRATLPLDGTR